ncbi:MAG: hypothetical protein QOI57_2782, partial [Rubrobacteraceae bacterium]|nr:hypothetical protein [Rubrobacteraceae bacterium]
MGAEGRFAMSHLHTSGKVCKTILGPVGRHPG